MAEPLDFKEFSFSTYEDWKKNVLKELGQNSFEGLTAGKEEGLNVSPYYTESDSRTFVQTTKEVKKGWEIRQDFFGNDTSQINKHILSALNGGVDSIGISTGIRSRQDLDLLLEGVMFDIVSIHFSGIFNPLHLLQWYVEKAKAAGYNVRELRGGISSALRVEDLASPSVVELAAFCREYLGSFRPFTISADPVHCSGGNATHEIAFALAMGNELLHRLNAEGFSAAEAASMTGFEFAVGTSYFANIAKLRVFRTLWSEVVRQYEPAISPDIFIHTITSRFLQTVYAPYNNVLRATSGAMSAVLGGADSISVAPHDEVFAEQNETSLRIARNIQHILTEESYFHASSSAADGSYYIEEMSLQLGNNAWQLFVEIENRGGIHRCEKYFRELVAENCSSQQAAVSTGKKTILGVNKFPDEEERYRRPRQGSTTERLSANLELERAKREEGVMK
ncbi:MAG: hypothetical protein IT223_02180 [Crocinitomicaceae bacterium]|nr:hypothetical protein [Crocinitomicaceae bacterium]